MLAIYIMRISKIMQILMERAAPPIKEAPAAKPVLVVSKSAKSKVVSMEVPEPAEIITIRAITASVKMAGKSI